MKAPFYLYSLARSKKGTDLGLGVWSLDGDFLGPQPASPYSKQQAVSPHLATAMLKLRQTAYKAFPLI